MEKEEQRFKVESVEQIDEELNNLEVKRIKNIALLGLGAVVIIDSIFNNNDATISVVSYMAGLYLTTKNSVSLLASISRKANLKAKLDELKNKEEKANLQNSSNDNFTLMIDSLRQKLYQNTETENRGKSI